MVLERALFEVDLMYLGHPRTHRLRICAEENRITIGYD
jgi:hypothetical protein